MRRTRWIGIMVVAALAALAPAALAAEKGAPPASALIYEGAEVETQVDVNGLAAVQLVGPLLDTVAAQAEEQAKAMQGTPAGAPGGGMQAGGGMNPMQMLGMAVPMIQPAKEAIKSLERITVLAMKPKGAIDGGQFVQHYAELMGGAGWSPLATVQDKGGTAVVAMLAPEAKGVFLAVNDKNEVVVALVTTTKPIGDLLSQVAQAGGGSLPMILSQINRPQPPPPPARVQTKPKTQEKPQPRTKTTRRRR